MCGSSARLIRRTRGAVMEPHSGHTPHYTWMGRQRAEDTHSAYLLSHAHTPLSHHLSLLKLECKDKIVTSFKRAEHWAKCGHFWVWSLLWQHRSNNHDASPGWESSNRPSLEEKRQRKARETQRPGFTRSGPLEKAQLETVKETGKPAKCWNDSHQFVVRTEAEVGP